MNIGDDTFCTFVERLRYDLRVPKVSASTWQRNQQKRVLIYEPFIILIQYFDILLMLFITIERRAAHNINNSNRFDPNYLRVYAFHDKTHEAMRDIKHASAAMQTN